MNYNKKSYIVFSIKNNTSLALVDLELVSDQGSLNKNGIERQTFRNYRNWFLRVICRNGVFESDDEFLRKCSR